MIDDKIGERFDGLDKGEAHGSGGAKAPVDSLIILPCKDKAISPLMKIMIDRDMRQG